MRSSMCFFLVGVSMAGCTNLENFVGPPPAEITVESALADVGNGLSKFKLINTNAGSNNGLLVDEVTVTLNVTASRSGSDKLVIDTKNIQPPALSGGNAGINSSSSRDAKNERSNVIVIKFKNRYTAQLNDQGKKGISPDLTTYQIIVPQPDK